MVVHQEEATPLSPAQRRFRRKNDALVGPKAYGREGLVFLYRDGPMLTRRWLVDRNGRVVQYDAFARTTEAHREPCEPMSVQVAVEARRLIPFELGATPALPLVDHAAAKFRLRGRAAHQTGELGETPVERDDGSVEGHQNESELYRKIIQRAKGVRERAAESLKRSRSVRNRQDLAEKSDAAHRRRRFRRQD